MRYSVEIEGRNGYWGVDLYEQVPSKIHPDCLRTVTTVDNQHDAEAIVEAFNLGVEMAERDARRADEEYLRLYESSPGEYTISAQLMGYGGTEEASWSNHEWTEVLKHRASVMGLTDIVWDSEYSNFFAYTKDHETAAAIVRLIETEVFEL